MMSVCPVCKQSVPPGTEWCPRDGTPLMPEAAGDKTFVGREQDLEGRPTNPSGEPPATLPPGTLPPGAFDRTVIRRTGDIPRPGPPVAEDAGEEPAQPDATVVRRAHEPAMTPFDDLDEGLSPTSVHQPSLGLRAVPDRLPPPQGRGAPITTPDGKAAPAEPDKDALLGTRLGEYTLKAVLGTGSMGVVYEGFHQMIGKKVAIKLLKREVADNEEEANRFLEEARAANAVGHRGIIDIFGFGTAPDGRPYFVMEKLQGQSLGAYLEKFAPLPLPQALQILDEILAALGAAHEAGVIHRDLKPNNIFLVSQPDKTMYVKVLDFGLAKRSQFARGDTPQTSVSRLVGTPDYMAPEQARGEPVGPRSDLYSLGCMAFEMLTGRPPFVANSGWEVVAMHMSTVPPTLSSLNSAVPAELSALVERLLSKTPAERPVTAEALRSELKRLRRGLRVEETRLFEVPPEPAEAPTLAVASLASLTAQATMQNLPPPRRASSGVALGDTQPRGKPLPRHAEPAVQGEGTDTLPPGGAVRSLSRDTIASLEDLKPSLWPYVLGTILFVGVLVAISVVLAHPSKVPEPPREPPPVRVHPPPPVPEDPPKVDTAPADPDPTPGTEVEPTTKKTPKNPKPKKGTDAPHPKTGKPPH